MTYDEIIDEALARVRDAGRNIPRRTLLRHIGQYQASLFQRAATWNPEYYGICVIADIAGGALDLNALTPPLNQAAGIQLIEVVASTGAGPAPGTRISVVPIEDTKSGLAPRATLRDNVLRQVGTELDLVTQIEIHYARLPNPVPPTGGAVEAELREPYQELLVLDCAVFIANQLAAEGRAVPAALVEQVQGELTVLMVSYEAQVRGYVTDVEDRFRRTGGEG